MKKYLFLILTLLATTWSLTSRADVWTRVDHASDAAGMGRVMWTEFENGALDGRYFVFVNSNSSTPNLTWWAQGDGRISAFASSSSDTLFTSQKYFVREGTWYQNKIFKLEYVGEATASYDGLQNVSKSMYRLYNHYNKKYVGEKDPSNVVGVFAGGSVSNQPYLVSTADSAVLFCFANAQEGTYAATTTNVLSYGGTANGGCVAITIAPGGGNLKNSSGAAINTTDYHYAVGAPGTFSQFWFTERGVSNIAWNAYEVTLPGRIAEFAQAAATAKWYLDKQTTTIGTVGGISAETAETYLTPLRTALESMGMADTVIEDSAKLYASEHIDPYNLATETNTLNAYWQNACNVTTNPVVKTVNSGKFYFIQGFSNYQDDQNDFDFAGNIIDRKQFTGEVIYARTVKEMPSTYSTDRYLALSPSVNYNNSTGNARAIWQVEQTTDGTVSFRNLASGYYINTVVPDSGYTKGLSNFTLNRSLTTHYTLDYAVQTQNQHGANNGPGWMRIIPSDHDQEALWNNWNRGNSRVTGWTKGGANQGGFWVLRQVEDPQDLRDFAAGYSIVTLPYRSAGPVAADGSTNVKAYSVVGLVKNNLGNTTGVGLKDITGQTIEAGTPFLLKVEGEDTISVNLNPDSENPAFSTTPTTANGLHGQLGWDGNLQVETGGVLISGDGSIDATASIGTVAVQSGYLVLSEVEGTETGDAQLPVASVLKVPTSDDSQGRAHEASVDDGAKVIFYHSGHQTSISGTTNPYTYLAASGNNASYPSTVSDAAVWVLESAGTDSLGNTTKKYYYVRNYATGKYISSSQKGNLSAGSSDNRNVDMNVSATKDNAIRFAIVDYGKNGGTQASYSQWIGMDQGAIDLVANPRDLKGNFTQHSGLLAVASNWYIGSYDSQWGWDMWKVQTGNPDPTALKAAVAAADSTLNLIGVVGGFAESASVATLRDTLANIDVNNISDEINNNMGAVVSYLSTLTAAVQANKLTEATDGAVYYIEGSNGAHNAEFTGAQVYVTSLKGGQPLRWRESNSVPGNYYPNTQGDARFMFQFKKNEAGLWTIQNLASGRYITLSGGKDQGKSGYTASGTATGFNLVVIPDGTIGFMDPTNKLNALHGNAQGQIVGWTSSKDTTGRAMQGSNCSFRLRPVTNVQILDSIAAGYNLVTLPYSVKGVPTATAENGAAVKAYRVSGYEAKSGYITNIKLKELSADSTIAAGTPFILHVEGTGKAQVAMNPNAAALGLTLTADTAANGLVGLLRADAKVFAADSIATITSAGTVQAIDSVATVALQTGYLVSTRINDEGEEADALLPVAEGTQLIALSAVDEMPVGFNIVTKPYRSLGPVGVDGTTVKAYTILGAEKDAIGIARKVGLKEITGDTIEAGTPFVLLVTTTDSVAKVDFRIDRSQTVDAPLAVNGLYGVLQSDSVKAEALAAANPIEANATITSIGVAKVADESGYLIADSVATASIAEADTTFSVASILKVNQGANELGLAHEGDVEDGDLIVLFNPSNNIASTDDTYLSSNTAGSGFQFDRAMSDRSVFRLVRSADKAMGRKTKKFYYLQNVATGNYLAITTGLGSFGGNAYKSGTTSGFFNNGDYNFNIYPVAADTLGADDNSAASHALRFAIVDYNNTGIGGACYATESAQHVDYGIGTIAVDLFVDQAQVLAITANDNGDSTGLRYTGGFFALAHNGHYIGSYTSQWGWYMWKVKMGAADITPITEAIASAQSTLKLIGLVGGYADGQSATTLRDTIAHIDVDNLGELTTSKVSAIASYINNLTAAVQADKITEPTDGGVYYIEGSNGVHNAEFEGAQVYVTSLAGGQQLRWRASNSGAGNYYPDTEGNARFMFQFKKNEAGLWTIQNLACGRYITLSGEQTRGKSKYTMTANATGYNVVVIPDGTIGISDPTNQANAFHGDRTGLIVGWAHNGNLTGQQWANSNCSFRLRPVTDVQILDSIAAGYSIVTLPYSVKGLPTAAQGSATAVKAYRVIGYNAENHEISAIKLKEMDASGIIPAGTPFILHVDGTEKVQLNMNPNAEALGLTLVADTANGLVGVLRAPVTIQAADTLATLDADGTVQSVDEPTVIALQTGYLVSTLISETGEDYDVLLSISDSGNLVGVQTAVRQDTGDVVNVYTIDGMLVRKQVSAATATQGLAKGLYIVGKKKVLVK